MGKLGAIPGVFAFLRPMPVLNISTGATNQNQGQYAYSAFRRECAASLRRGAEADGETARSIRDSRPISSDFFDHTPNLEINIRRDQARTYGVSETRILNLLRNAYSQNYLYLIKKPEDQYQVILEVKDSERAKADDLSLLYIRSDDGKNLVPLNTLVDWKTSLGPQTVNHLNQFTSVTIFFNLKPGVAIGDATNFISKAEAEIVPPTVRASLQGEALTFRDTVRDLTILMALAVFVMYVILAILYESYVHPLTVLSTLPTALVGGLLTLYHFRRAGVALRVRRHVHADGHREEKRNHDRGFRAAARGCRRDGGESHSRREHGPLPSDPDDHARRGHRRRADRRGIRSRRSFAPSAGHGDRRRTGGVAVHHAIRDAGDLSVPRSSSRKKF